VEDRSGEALRSGAWRSRRVWLVVALYLALTTWLSLELNVWRDEMYSLHSSSGSPGFAFRQALDFELQPPLYFVLLSLWRGIDHSVFFARLLSSLLGCGAIVAAAALGERLLPKVHPVWIAAVVATHPLVVWAGTEIRVYALIFLLSTLMTLAFFDAHWVPGRRGSARLVFAALALLSVYTQYYLAALLACFGLALLVRRDRQAVERYAVDIGVVSVFALPLLVAAKVQLGSHRNDFGPELSLGVGTLHLVATRFESYIFSFNKAIDEARWSLGTIRVARWAYRALVLAAIAIPAWSLRRRVDVRSLARRWPLFVIVAGYALCMLFLLRMAGPLSVGERHTAAIVIPALLAAIAVPAFAFGRFAAVLGAAFLIASNVPATLLTLVVPLAKDCDCRRVAETIGAREIGHEPILVFPSEDALPLAVYYQGQNRLVPVPRPASFDRWDQQTFVIDDVSEISGLIGRDDHAGLWVHTGTYGTSWGQDKLEQFLAKGYREDEEREFFKGVRLRHFVRNGLAER
jgi:hypothetical protein